MASMVVTVTMKPATMNGVAGDWKEGIDPLAFPAAPAELVAPEPDAPEPLAFEVDPAPDVPVTEPEADELVAVATTGSVAAAAKSCEDWYVTQLDEAGMVVE